MDNLKQHTLLNAVVLFFALLLLFFSFQFTGVSFAILLTLGGLCLFTYVHFSYRFFALVRQKELLFEEQLKKGKSQEALFSLVLHELTGPAQNLMLVADLVNNQTFKEDDFQEVINIIHRSANKHFNLVQKLTDWTKTKVNLNMLETEDFDVRFLIENICRDYKTLYEKKGITVKILAENTFVNTEKCVLELILRNVFHNAVKFTPEGGKIHITAIKTFNKLTISVNDNGIGMCKESVDNLFVPKMKGYNSNSPKGRESEIGLILCHDLLNKIGGSLTAGSKLHEGSTFTFSLPIKENSYHQTHAAVA